MSLRIAGRDNVWVTVPPSHIGLQGPDGRIVAVDRVGLDFESAGLQGPALSTIHGTWIVYDVLSASCIHVGLNKGERFPSNLLPVFLQLIDGKPSLFVQVGGTNQEVIVHASGMTINRAGGELGAPAILDVEEMEDGFVALKHADGYLSAEPPGNFFYNRPAAKRWERFRIVPSPR